LSSSTMPRLSPALGSSGAAHATSRQPGLRRVAACLLILAAVAARDAEARTWFVNWNGGSDFLTITAACAAAASGDTVAVLAGSYHEYDGPGSGPQLNGKSLSLIGWAEGPEDVVATIHLEFRDCPTVRIEGMTFRECPIAVDYAGGESLTIDRCRFEDCTYDQSASAVRFVAPNARLQIEDCVFVGNQVEDDEAGGAVTFEGNGSATILRCAFTENTGASAGAAISATGGDIDIEDCLFLRNTAVNGPAVYASQVRRLAGCTFYENQTTSDTGAALFVNVVLNEIERCIIARTQNGYGFDTDLWASTRCSCYWQNQKGPTGGSGQAPASYGNIFTDPLFCGAGDGDFTLDAASPCLPGPHGGVLCGRMGRFDVGCGGSPTQKTSWGAIKARFHPESPAAGAPAPRRDAR